MPYSARLPAEAAFTGSLDSRGGGFGAKRATAVITLETALATARQMSATVTEQADRQGVSLYCGKPAPIMGPARRWCPGSCGR